MSVCVACGHLQTRHIHGAYECCETVQERRYHGYLGGDRPVMVRVLCTCLAFVEKGS